MNKRFKLNLRDFVKTGYQCFMADRELIEIAIANYGLKCKNVC